MVLTISACATIGAAVAVRLIVLADADRRDHAHAACSASRDANAGDRAADQSATIGDQHDLLALLDRECRDHLSALGEVHELHALTAAAGNTVLVGGSALAEAGRGHGEHEFFLLLKFLEALPRQGSDRRG